MTITAIQWEHGGFDLHLLADETSGPLISVLEFFRIATPGGTETGHNANDPLPAGVTVSFHAEFNAVGAQPINKHKGHGVEVDENTGAIKVDPGPLPTPRLHNFMVRAEVRDADNGLDIRVRIHTHESIQKIWLTPRSLNVHQGTTHQQFTVLAEFDDGTNGDITGRRDLSYRSSDDTIATVAASGKITYVANGLVLVTVSQGTLPAPADLTDTADVFTEPSLATERRIVRVRGRGATDFDKKVNIMFLSDGFKDTEKQHFNNIVDRIVNQLQTDVHSYPYNILKDSINYWRLHDDDFLASTEENVSILSEASIRGRRRMHSRRLPFPTDPGVRTRWEVEHLIFKFGLPVHADRNKSRAAKRTDWATLYDLQATDHGKIQNRDFRVWRRLHSRKLLNERDTALGFAIDDHPRADQDEDRSLFFHSRRVSVAQFTGMVEKLRRGAAPGVNIVGTTWTTGGTDEGLVCVLGRSRRSAGDFSAVRFSSSLAEDSEQRVEVSTRGSRRGLDLVKMELLHRGKLRRLHPAVPITVAHECAHAFDLKDEYGGGFNYPSHKHAGIAAVANVQPETEIQTTAPPPAAGIDGERIKWNWPRLVAAGRLVSKPTPTGANFHIDFEPGQAAQFAVDDIVRLRKKDHVVVPPSDAFSDRFKVVSTPAPTPDRIEIAPEPGTAINPDDFPPGSSLVKPKTGFAAVGVGDDLPLIAPMVQAHIEGQNLPLNRTAAACTQAADPVSIMIPTNRPAGLSRRRPANKANIIGIYDGGDVFDCGVFHPAGLCIMRRLRRPSGRSARFCHVCRYAIIDRVDVTKHEHLDSVYENFDYPEP